MHARTYGCPIPRLSAAFRARLLAHDWPGNVRELRNMLEQAVIFGGGAELDPSMLAMAVTTAAHGAQDGFALPVTGIDLEQLERSLTLQALERSAWNLTKAGRLLGLSRDAVRYRVEKFQLRSDEADHSN
jgi:DNA-binding NtrC family response regulator